MLLVVLKIKITFPRKLLLTNTQMSNLCNANIKLFYIQLHKIGHLLGFLGRCLEPLLKIDCF